MPELKNADSQPDEVHQKLADKAANQPIDTYLQADEVKRALDYFAHKADLHKDPEVIAHKEKIENILNEPTKFLDAKYLLDFKRACSIMGIFTVSQEIEQAEKTIAELEKELQENEEKFEKRIEILEKC